VSQISLSRIEGSPVNHKVTQSRHRSSVLKGGMTPSSGLRESLTSGVTHVSSVVSALSFDDDDDDDDDNDI